MTSRPTVEQSAASIGTVLVVDDDPDLRTALAEFLNGQGFEALEASDGVAAIQQVRARRPAAVVLDILMPRLSGLHTLQVIQAIAPCTVVIVLTGALDSGLQRLVTAAGPHATLLKPAAFSALGAILQGAMSPVPTDVRASTSRHDDLSV